MFRTILTVSLSFLTTAGFYVALLPSTMGVKPSAYLHFPILLVLASAAVWIPRVLLRMRTSAVSAGRVARGGGLAEARFKECLSALLREKPMAGVEPDVDVLFQIILDQMAKKGDLSARQYVTEETLNRALAEVALDLLQLRGWMDNRIKDIEDQRTKNDCIEDVNRLYEPNQNKRLDTVRDVFRAIRAG